MPELPPFAAAEKRANAAVIEKLANALATIGAAAPVWAIFENEYTQAQGGAEGIAASLPLVKLPTAHVPARPQGQHLRLETRQGLSHWRIVEHHPDGAGISLLFLERA